MSELRLPRVDVFLDYGTPYGVLVLRLAGESARNVARAALVIDHGWSPADAESAIDGAQVRVGRWFRVPDRSGEPGASLLVLDERDCGSRAGSTPGVYFTLP